MTTLGTRGEGVDNGLWAVSSDQRTQRTPVRLPLLYPTCRLSGAG